MYEIREFLAMEFPYSVFFSPPRIIVVITVAGISYVDSQKKWEKMQAKRNTDQDQTPSTTNKNDVQCNEMSHPERLYTSNGTLQAPIPAGSTDHSPAATHT